MRLARGSRQAHCGRALPYGEQVKDWEGTRARVAPHQLPAARLRNRCALGPFELTLAENWYGSDDVYFLTLTTDCFDECILSGASDAVLRTCDPTSCELGERACCGQWGRPAGVSRRRAGKRMCLGETYANPSGVSTLGKVIRVASRCYVLCGAFLPRCDKPDGSTRKVDAAERCRVRLHTPPVVFAQP